MLPVVTSFSLCVNARDQLNNFKIIIDATMPAYKRYSLQPLIIGIDQKLCVFILLVILKYEQIRSWILNDLGT